MSDLKRRQRSALGALAIRHSAASALWRGFDLSTHGVYSMRKFEQSLTNIDER